MDIEKDSSTPNDLGKIIKRRKELKITQQQIGNVFGHTKQWWSIQEKKYEDSEGSFNLQLSMKNCKTLNQLLQMPMDDSFHVSNDPMVFDEPKIFSTALEDAKKRDYQLTFDMLQCINEVEEPDLKILFQTVNAFSKRSLPYRYEESLLFLAAIRNSITDSIRHSLPNDEALKKFIHQCNEAAELETDKPYGLRIELIKIITDKILEEARGGLAKPIDRFLEDYGHRQPY